MNILDAIVNAQGGAAVRQLGREVASRAATQTGLSAAMLSPLLDQNRDGSIVDDVTSMIGRFMKTRSCIAFLKTVIRELAQERGSKLDLDELDAVMGFLDAVMLQVPFREEMEEQRKALSDNEEMA